MKLLLKTSLILWGAIIASGSVLANEKNFIKLSTIDSVTYFASTGTLNHRVGSTVWVKLIERDARTPNNFTFDLLMSCSQDLFTNSVRSNLTKSENLTGHYKASAKRDFDTAEYPVFFVEEPRLPAIVVQKLRANKKSICSSASKKEPKGKLFPASNSVNKSNTGGTIYSLVLGTAKVRPNGHIEIWAKDSDFITSPHLDERGEQYVIDGKGLTFVDFSKSNYEMRRYVFDCVEEKIGLMGYTKYESAGNVLDSAELSSPSKLEMTSVVPDSVGAQQLEAACFLYGK